MFLIFSKVSKISDNVLMPVIDLVEELLEEAIKRNASDVHIQSEDNYITVRFRLFGELKIYKLLKNISIESISSRIKVISRLNISETRMPQDGRIDYFLEGKKYDIRVSTFPVIKGEKIVLRILNGSSKFNKDNLGFKREQVDIIQRLIKYTKGLILVTGPTGSGKTTTLYSLIEAMNKESLNIITIEDPVENIIKGITQIEINEKIGLDFSNVLRSILRQDPDVIMVGEIRDEITAKLALQASMTGHLVLATLHTNDAASAIWRLLNMNIDKYLIAEGVNAVISQKLIRKECSNYDFENNICNINETCKGFSCSGNGYIGRTAEAEILIMDEKIKNYIMQGKSSEFIKRYYKGRDKKVIKLNFGGMNFE